MENDESRKGVKTKLFGIILIFLGVLDSMLSWRGGFAVNDFYALLIAPGILLYKDLPGLFFGPGQVVVATVGASTVGLGERLSVNRD